jgi:transcriptional regulator GlxA family with amidase domain
MRLVPPVRRVLVLAVDRAQSLDVLGPVEVFDTARALAPEAGYRLEVVAPTADGRVTLSNGLALHAEPLPDPPPAHHTLLAEAGLLEGRPATTHWRWCESLADRHPGIALDPDAVYVHDGNVWTSAGVTAGIDLALALVEEDVGRDVALAVAQELVVFLRRPGGQSQFSRALAAQQATRPALRELQGWIAGHLDADLSVAALAARANLTERSFSRAFRREVGQTPAAYVEALRVERARILLEDGAESLHAVARATGFASAEVLRRAFHRRVGVSPAAYRERFRAAA